MSHHILLGLCGGVDSAVAAHLLLQQGYHITAGFMINYADPDNPNCHTRADFREAKKVADFLGIQLKTFDFRSQYHDRIISYIQTEYAQGRTPNPDVFCNNLIKFDLFLDEALKLGCTHIATGHYARLSASSIRRGSGGGQKILNKKKLTGGHTLFRGIDPIKDQSYFLSHLTPFQLDHALFPLGELTKQEVRTIAKKIGLPNADRPDSQGLCFIGKVSIKDFLKDTIGLQQGDIVDKTGNKIGTHDGAWQFTLGQKKGLGLPYKAYVIATDVKSNTVTVSDHRDDALLYKKAIYCTDRHRFVPTTPSPDGSGEGLGVRSTPQNYYCKIRHTQVPQPCVVKREDGQPIILPEKPIRSVPAGQIAVLYKDDQVLGSGIIN